ncbi:MAG: polysulfide reductase NrfD, partial [candidate division NC10 bacterium]|nr:polysulfide reductase NrfD [candidate division NC10 bacterium]
IAELITLVSMTAAVMNITLDVGRPERFIVNVVPHGQWRAPFVWSMTVISTYVVGSTVYLYLAMRRDLCICAAEIPRRRWLYGLLSIAYSDSEGSRRTHGRVVWWCAVIILPIMVSVHSVYGYVFGLQAGRPGWYNPFLAPYFVLGAIVTGFSAIIVVVAILRRVFRWQEYFPPRMFKGLGIFLGFVTLLYLYFFFSEQLTGQYSAPAAERAVSNDLLWGRFAWLTWSSVIGGLVIPFWALFIQGARPGFSSIPLTVACAILINVALWIKRFLIVVPSFYHPHLPYRVAEYTPTPLEWTVMGGTWIFAIFFFSILVKLLPVIEIPPGFPLKKNYAFQPGLVVSRAEKAVVVLLTVLAGIGMIAYGFATRDLDYAPVKWLTGILLLCAVPLEICLIRTQALRRYAY